MGGEGDPEMWKYFIAIEGPGGMWKDFISRHIEGLGRGDVERLCCHKWFRVWCGGGRRKELSALTPTPNRLYIGSGSKSY